MTNTTLKQWPSPAKLNLFLHFISQRANGYHNLQSVFQLLDFGDSLEFDINTSTSQAGTIEFSCSTPELSDHNNLVVSAANTLKRYARQEFSRDVPGTKIHLNKKLPVGGGVGGGSSNCATALVALNQLWGLELTTTQLAEIGLALGADVPIFIHGNTAFVEGIGEIITPIDMPDIWYLVIQPECQISTAKIFSDPLLTRNSKAITIRDLNALELPYHGDNTMQALVCKAYPEVREVITWLKQFSPHARMTGSGSCVFAPFDNEREMRRIASRCEWAHFVARGVNHSPLMSNS